jgi:hypothetical protein
MTTEAVKEIVKEFGGQARMAVALGVLQQSVANWVKQGYVPLKYVKAVSLTTKQKMKDYIKPEYLEAHELLKEQNEISY